MRMLRWMILLVATILLVAPAMAQRYESLPLGVPMNVAQP
jgi:hypothetical protein